MIIFGGRFQPFHKGHINMLKKIKELYPNENVCVGIIKDIKGSENTAFNNGTRARLAENIFNAELTLKIINTAIREVPELSTNVFVTLMPYPNYSDWEMLKNLLDCDRIWAFSGYKDKPDEWELEKAKFFTEQNEKFIFIPIETKDISGTEIRKAVIDKDYELLNKYLMPSTVDIIRNLK